MATPIPANDARFTLDEILRATGGVLAMGNAASTSTSVSTDSRAVKDGALFVAFAGDSFDGHEHVESAVKAGARTVVVERDVANSKGASVVRVASTLDALGALARAHARRWRENHVTSVVAITGSAGKTTTRLATSALLEALFPGKVLASRGNLNNRVGLPMTLFGLEPRHRVAVLEMGMNQPGEIEKLAAVAEPDVGVLTLIDAAHTEGVGSIEGVAHEKGALLRALTPSGVAIGNADDARVRGELASAGTQRRHLYGRAPDADVRILGREAIDLRRSRLELARRGSEPIRLTSPLLGEAGACACAAAVAVAEIAFDLRVSSELATKAFSATEVGAGAGRLLPRVASSGLAILDDSYNANPASMRASIAAAAEIARASDRRLVLVLGEMRELGDAAEAAHDDIGAIAAASGALQIIGVSGRAERFAIAARAASIESAFASDARRAGELIVAAARPGDLVLVKGSRGVGLERAVSALLAANGGEEVAP